MWESRQAAPNCNDDEAAKWVHCFHDLCQEAVLSTGLISTYPLAYPTAASCCCTLPKTITYQKRIAAGQGLQAEDMQAELQRLRTEVLLLRAEKQQALAAVKVSIGTAASLQCLLPRITTCSAARRAPSSPLQSACSPTPGQCMPA